MISASMVGVTACDSSTGFSEGTGSHGAADPGGELDGMLCVEVSEPSWDVDPASLPSGFRALRLPASDDPLGARLTTGPIDGARRSAIVVTGNALLTSFGQEDDLEMVAHDPVPDGGWRQEPSERAMWSATTGRLYGVDLGLPARRVWVRTPTGVSGMLGTDAWALKPTGMEVLEFQDSGFEVRASFPRPANVAEGGAERLFLSWLGNPRLATGERVVAGVWTARSEEGIAWSEVIVARWNAAEDSFEVLGRTREPDWSGGRSTFGQTDWGRASSMAMLPAGNADGELSWARIELDEAGVPTLSTKVALDGAIPGELRYASMFGDDLVAVHETGETSFTVWNVGIDGAPSQRVGGWEASASITTQVRFGDIDGDGRVDVVHHEFSGEVWLDLSSVEAPRVLQAGDVGNVDVEDLQGDGRDEVIVQVHGDADEPGELLVLQFSDCP